jgi:hypothetical protein
MAGLCKSEDGVAADESGSAGDKDRAHAAIIDWRFRGGQALRTEIRLQFSKKRI